MIYTLIGDPHAKVDNLDKIEKVYKLAESLGNPIITLGDLLDTKSLVQSKCLNFYIKLFQESKLNHIILVGNHDYHNSECIEHSLEPLKTLSNVTVIDKPTQLDKLFLLPYYSNLQAFKEAIQIPSREGQTLIMHQGINGFDYGNGFFAENEVNGDEIKGFKRVISGHFHKEQGIYIGTPFSHDFGESNQTKYIATYNTETDELKLIKTLLPQHYKVEINCDDEMELNRIYEVNSQDHYRFILQGMQTNIQKFPKKNYPYVKFFEEPLLLQGEGDLKESDTPHQIFHQWANDIAKLDKDTIEIGLRILEDTK